MKTTLTNVISAVDARARYCFQMLVLPTLIAALASGCARPAASTTNQTGKGGTTNALEISQSELVGKYALISVDGKSVPCKIGHEGRNMQINSGGFVFMPDATCLSQIFLQGRERPVEVDATYTIHESKVIMRWKRAGITEGTLKGDTFTMNNEGMVFAYRKEAKY